MAAATSGAGTGSAAAGTAPTSSDGQVGGDTRVEAGIFTSRYVVITCGGPPAELSIARDVIRRVTRDPQREQQLGWNVWATIAVPTSPWTPNELRAGISREGGAHVRVEVRQGGVGPADAVIDRARQSAQSAAGAVGDGVSNLFGAGSDLAQSVSFWARWGPAIGIALTVLLVALVVWILLRGLRYLASPEAGRAIGNVGGIKKVLA